MTVGFPRIKTFFPFQDAHLELFPPNCPVGSETEKNALRHLLKGSVPPAAKNRRYVCSECKGGVDKAKEDIAKDKEKNSRAELGEDDDDKEKENKKEDSSATKRELVKKDAAFDSAAGIVK